jgi:putative membrane protein
MKENKNVVRFIWVFTVIVYALVIILHELPQADYEPAFVSFLPMVNAIINGTCFVLLIAALIAIKRKNIGLHKAFNTTAMALSVIFLLSYVTNHYFSGDTKYAGEYSTLFYFILITHIALAGISLPFILLAYYRGLTGNIQRHKRLVRFTYPIWLYVTLTGVLVYIFLAPFY